MEDYTPQTDREWKAWRSMCHKMRDADIDVDAADEGPLRVAFDAIRLWGEELALLRSQHSHETCEKALAEARDAAPIDPRVDLD